MCSLPHVVGKVTLTRCNAAFQSQLHFVMDPKMRSSITLEAFCGVGWVGHCFLGAENAMEGGGRLRFRPKATFRATAYRVAGYNLRLG